MAKCVEICNLRRLKGRIFAGGYLSNGSLELFSCFPGWKSLYTRWDRKSDKYAEAARNGAGIFRQISGVKQLGPGKGSELMKGL